MSQTTDTEFEVQPGINNETEELFSVRFKRYPSFIDVYITRNNIHLQTVRVENLTENEVKTGWGITKSKI